MTEDTQPTPAETTEIILAHPYSTAAGVRIEKLTMRRPKVKDQRAVRRQFSADADVEVALLARLCGIVQEDLDDMDEMDYTKLQTAYLSFRGLSL